MATSTFYGWAEPDNSSLVKNGASDIRTLGDAIDTSVWNVGFGQAGKNKIINGDFRINQRNFTSVTATGSFTFDRWKTALSGGTVTYTPQTFSLGAAPVAGYEGSTFLQVVTSGQSAAGDYAQIVQPIESVRTFAGQTVTMSFWAKAVSGTPKLATEFSQWFGSGGSPSSQVNTYGGQVTLSTSWARYSVTVAIPSISGKTLGTDGADRLEPKLWLSAGSTFDSRTGTLGIQNNTFSIWGVQVEYGSKATPFQTASGGSPQAELAMCQRYFQKSYLDSTAPGTASTTQGAIMCAPDAVVSYKSFPNVIFPVQMRGSVTVTIYNPSTGTAGLSTGIRDTGASTNKPIFINNTNMTGFQSYVDNSSTNAGNQLMFHYTASSEL